VHDTTVKTTRRHLIAAAWLAALAIASAAAWAQQSEEEIALAAQNPVAAMVSLPLQYNYDQNIGPREDGHKNYVNVQPVIPFSLNQDWNLISRTIVPVVWQSDLFPGAGSQSGIGDIT
jgi:nitrate reductase cytochrome c-type subunit